MTIVMAKELVNAYLKSEGEITDGGELPEYVRGDSMYPIRS